MNRLLVIGCLFVVAPNAWAQSCGSPDPRPYFEFQVTQPARYLGDTLTRPRPATDRFAASASNSAAFIVQFVVDSTGRPDARSMKVLRAPSAVAADSVRAGFTAWRFSPAVVGGCRVAQLVQTSIVR